MLLCGERLAGGCQVARDGRDAHPGRGVSSPAGTAVAHATVEHGSQDEDERGSRRDDIGRRFGEQTRDRQEGHRARGGEHHRDQVRGAEPRDVRDRRRPLNRLEQERRGAPAGRDRQRVREQDRAGHGREAPHGVAVRPQPRAEHTGDRPDRAAEGTDGAFHRAVEGVLADDGRDPGHDPEGEAAKRGGGGRAEVEHHRERREHDPAHPADGPGGPDEGAARCAERGRDRSGEQEGEDGIHRGSFHAPCPRTRGFRHVVT
jgi:hypothetical protein